MTVPGKARGSAEDAHLHGYEWRANGDCCLQKHQVNAHQNRDSALANFSRIRAALVLFSAETHAGKRNSPEAGRCGQRSISSRRHQYLIVTRQAEFRRTQKKIGVGGSRLVPVFHSKAATRAWASRHRTTSESVPGQDLAKPTRGTHKPPLGRCRRRLYWENLLGFQSQR